MERKIQRLAESYINAIDQDEKDAAFSRLMALLMRLPVVTATHRRTWTRVGGQNPRFAEDEDQAIRRAVWRALGRYDASRGVPFARYVSVGIKIALRDFWSQEAWRSDVPVKIPVAQWRAYRRAAGIRAGGGEAEFDAGLYELCAVSPLHDDISVIQDAAVYDIYDFGDDSDGSF